MNVKSEGKRQGVPEYTGEPPKTDPTGDSPVGRNTPGNIVNDQYWSVRGGA